MKNWRYKKDITFFRRRKLTPNMPRGTSQATGPSMSFHLLRKMRRMKLASP